MTVEGGEHLSRGQMGWLPLARPAHLTRTASSRKPSRPMYGVHPVRVPSRRVVDKRARVSTVRIAPRSHREDAWSTRC